jgi:glycolate oxidase FAD binding subunit
MHEPQSVEDACEIVRACASQRRTMGLTGGDRISGPAAVAVDDLVSTRRMNRIVEYAPADQIVTVEAGKTVAELANILRENEQRLAIDPPQPEQTTIGALVASNAYGALRCRFGTAKDLIVGMTIVRADGTRARGGGKVVKNVAGFDIPKLMVGTYGTLALIASVTFRLHPLPRARAVASVRGLDAAGVRALSAAMTKAQLEPSAITASFDGAHYRCDVTFEGFAAGVRAQRERFAALAPDIRDCDEPDAEHHAARTGELVVKVTAAPSRVEALHAAAITPLHRALDNAHACMDPSVGIAFISGVPADTSQVLDALTAARSWAESAGGSLVVQSAPPSLRAAFNAWGTPPPSFGLMRALKERFDPQRLLQPGGFVGGL